MQLGCGRRRPVIAMATAVSTNEGNVIKKCLKSTKTFMNQVVQVMNQTREELIQSSIARVIVITLLYPLDSLKTRIQMTTRASRASISGIPGAWSSSNWYGGLTPTILGQIPHGAISFSLFSVLQHNFKNNEHFKNKRITTILAACLADGITSLWLAPTELLKIRVQSGLSHNFKNALAVGRLNNGIFSQILRDAPFRAVYLVMFDMIREQALKKNSDSKKPLSKLQHVSISAGAGAGVAAITTPVDVVRTRIMAQYPKSSKLYGNWLHCIGRTIRQEGIAGLYRGVVPRTVYVAASIAMFIFTFETVKHISEEHISEGKRFSKVSHRAGNKNKS